MNKPTYLTRYAVTALLILVALFGFRAAAAQEEAGETFDGEGLISPDMLAMPEDPSQTLPFEGVGEDYFIADNSFGVSPTDAAALRAIYEKMTPMGKLQSGWLSGNENACSWTGVNCDGETVVGLNFDTVDFFCQIPAEFAMLPSLREIHMRNTLVHGIIPDELFVKDTLKVIDLSNNLLTGPIPSNIYLPNLEILSLTDNKLTEDKQRALDERPALGGCQSELNYPPELNIDLTPGLDGEIPASIGTLSLLRQLDLSGNNLGGRLPDELIYLYSLDTIYLNDNSTENAFSTDNAELITKLQSLPDYDLSGVNFIEPLPTDTEVPTPEPLPTDTEVPTPEPLPTDTEVPTPEPLPTDTEVPTPEPLPTNTDVPTPEPLPTNTPVYVTMTPVPPTATNVVHWVTATPQQSFNWFITATPYRQWMTATPGWRYMTATPMPYVPPIWTYPTAVPQYSYPTAAPQYNYPPAAQGYVQPQPTYYYPQTARTSAPASNWTPFAPVATSTKAPTVNPASLFDFKYDAAQMTADKLPVSWKYTGMDSYMINYLTKNRTLFPGFAMEWMTADKLCSGERCSFEIINIPNDLLKDGVFYIQLQGRDKSGRVYQSDPIGLQAAVTPEPSATPIVEEAKKGNWFTRFFRWLFGPIIRLFGGK